MSWLRRDAARGIAVAGLGVLLTVHASLAQAQIPFFPAPDKMAGRAQEAIADVMRTMAGTNRMAAAIASTPVLERARSARDSGDLEGAATHYREALDLLGQGSAAAAGPQVMGALTGYGAVLVDLHRWEEAKPILARAVASLDALQRDGGAMLPVGLMLQGSFQTAGEASRVLNLNIVIEGETADPRGDFARERLPPTSNPAALLARTHLELGDPASVAPLYRRYVQTLNARQAQPLAQWATDPALLALSHAPAEADLQAFAAILYKAGNPTLGREALERAWLLNLERLRATTRFPSQEMFLGAVRQRRLMTGLFLQQSLENPSQLAPDALRWIASSKGAATRFAMARRSIINGEEGLQASQARARLNELEQQLASTPLVGEKGLDAYTRWMNSYAGAVEAFRPALTRANIEQSIDDGTTFVSRIRQRIGANAHIGFIQYRPVDSRTLEPAEPRYLRYVVTADTLQIKDVGSRREVDRAVSLWRQQIDRPLADLPGDPLAKALLADLPASAQSASAWQLDPDGLLHLLAFESLPDGGGRAVVQRRSIQYVDAISLPFAGTEARTPTDAIVVGDPAFADEPRPAPTPLPETRAEAHAVAGVLQRSGLTAKAVLGPEATPSALRPRKAPAVMHVATHGFIRGPHSWPLEDGRSTRLGVIVPGLLAGLMLAPEGDQSSFTANELAALDLRGTRLVVLSACDTGNGTVDVGEGLSSLRRAALVAGAGHVVTSLWAVPSAQTADLMARFYDLMASGASPQRALQTVKSQAIAAGWPVRAWAGFVLATTL